MSPFMLLVRRALTLALLGLVLVACQVANPFAPRDSIQSDAAAYAAEFGVSVDEAVRRLKIQEEIHPLRQRLREAAGDHWAGGWLEHRPKFRFVVMLTEGGPDLSALTADWPLPVELITHAKYTESQLLAGMKRIDELMFRRLPTSGMWPDAKTGSIIINGPVEPSAEFLAELNARAKVLVRFEPSPLEVLEASAFWRSALLAGFSVQAASSKNGSRDPTNDCRG